VSPSPLWVGVSAFDPGGIAGSLYQLAVSNGPFTTLLDTVTAVIWAGPGPPMTFAVGPSPAHRSDLVTVSIPEVRGTLGRQVTDLEVRVYDVSGREVALLAEHRSGQSSMLQWTPATYGLRGGLYWMRLRSDQAGYSETRRIVVLD